MRVVVRSTRPSVGKRARANQLAGINLLLLACVALLGWGFWVREEVYVTAREGTGYLLGLVGLGCMATLLLYSVRKRARFLSGTGPIRRWLRVHMALGLLGPVAILFHANFQLGSLNSTVALGCVLLVASSGIVGRLIYPRIHHELTGRRATLGELRKAAAERKDALGAALASHPWLGAELAAVERASLQGAGLAGALRRLAPFDPGARALRRRVARRLAAAPGAADILRELDVYLSAVRRAATFQLYERAFSLWHAFHLPLCILLFATAAIHVVAAHMY
jgi:hypothetical protein